MKRNLLLAFSFLSLFTMSCEQDELAELKSQSASAVSSSEATITSAEGRANLLAEGRFEPSLNAPFRTQIFTSYGLEMSSNIVRNGNKSARFEMRRGDGKIRAEILLPGETSRNRWYGNSIYLPSESFVNDMNNTGWDIITQWHAVEDAGEGARFPPLALVVNKGRLSFVIYWASKQINSNTTIDGKKVFDLGPVEKDKWLDMVYHINYSHGSDGVLEVWKNGTKVVNFRGPNSYNDNKYPYFKIGIYKRAWNAITKRVLYVDDVRTGNGNASYNDVVPAGSANTTPTPTPETPTTETPTPPTTDAPTPETPTTTEPLALALINANTDQPLQMLTDGATVDLASLPTQDLNIEAVSNTTIGSVKFDLTGAQTQNVIQSGAPYSLFGDSGGNFNAWLPKDGNYTLNATSYSGANGSGTVGATKTVSFKVINTATDGSAIPTATLLINNNAATATTRNATLNITSVNATQMRFYDDSNNTWTAWEPIATTKAWTLSTGNGSKWVKVQVMNVAGVMSATASDGIILEIPTTDSDTPTTPTTPTTPEVSGTPSVTFAINNNASSTSSANVILNIKAVNATQMRFYDNSSTTWSNWEPVSATKTWTLSSGDGSKWVKIQVKNATGSASASDGIVLDMAGTPTVKMVINNNAATTSSRNVTLNITAENATQMRFYDNSNSTWTSWLPVSATKAWTLSSGDGSKWVKVQIKNAAGKMSTSTSDGIILKTL